MQLTTPLGRRLFTQAAAAAAATSVSPLVLAADTLKIGYVSPQTAVSHASCSEVV